MRISAGNAGVTCRRGCCSIHGGCFAPPGVMSVFRWQLSFTKKGDAEGGLQRRAEVAELIGILTNTKR